MPIRTSKNKIYRKIQESILHKVNCHIGVRDFIYYDTPSSGLGPMTCPGRKAVLHHVNQRPTTPACTWWNRPEEYNSSGKLESTHPSRTSVKSDQVFFGVESVNDLTTDLIMANNNNNTMPSSAHSFTTCPGRDTVLRYTLVGTQFYDLHGLVTDGTGLNG